MTTLPIGRGVNVDVLNPAGDPEPRQLLARGFTSVRLVSKPDPNGPGVHPHIEERLAQYKAAGIAALVVITNESQGRIPANNHGLLQLGNEPDGQPPSSQVQTPDAYIADWQTYVGSYPQFRWIAAGLCSGDPSWWARVAPALDNCAGVAVHVYKTSLVQAEALLEQYRAVRPELDLYVTEWNPLGTSSLSAYDWAMRSRTAGAFYFCWSDGMVPGFGLFRADGTPKPQLAAFSPVAPTPTPNPTPAPAPKPSPAPLPAKCWDRAQLITAGFSPTDASGFCADFGTRRTIEAIVYHDMEGYLPGALARWNAGAAGAHLAILRDGTVVLTCRLEDVAWHAGTGNDPNSGVYGRTSFWRQHNINPHSVGIELEGFADAHDGGYTPAQRASLRRVTDWLCAKYGIARKHTTDQVAGLHLHGELSTSRTDPGPTWNWGWVL